VTKIRDKSTPAAVSARIATFSLTHPGSTPGRPDAIGLFAAPTGKAVGDAGGRAYHEGMKVSITCAAVRAMSPPVAAA